MRLLSLTLDEIDEFTRELEEDSKALKKDLLKLCWYMRGGLSLAELYELDTSDRTLIASIVEENLETTKTSGLPFF
jgi:hypothetical protein